MTVKVAVGVPTMSNFKGLAELFASLWGADYTPFVVNNWTYNNGCSKAWNEILLATQGYQLTVICNDDITFRPESFRHLINGWQEKPIDGIMLTGTTHEESTNEYNIAPDYSCFMVNPNIYLDKIGLFDENFTPAYFEDNDSHYRIKLAGRQAYNYRHAIIDHKGSQTQNANPNSPVVTSPMFEKNRRYYVDKWGGWPGQEKYIRPYNDSTFDWREWRAC